MIDKPEPMTDTELANALDGLVNYGRVELEDAMLLMKVAGRLRERQRHSGSRAEKES